MANTITEARKRRMMGGNLEMARAIAELIEATFTAICETCGDSDTVSACDLDEAVTAFHEDKWRVENGKLMCFRCWNIKT